MKLFIRAAGAADAALISSVLIEAAEWLRARGNPMWKVEGLAVGAIGSEAENYWIAEDPSKSVAGVVKLQLDDPEFWPDIEGGESVFVHRLAVRRRFAGGGVSKFLLEYAVQRTEFLGKRYVRLDCASDRPKLREVYERNGFSFHSMAKAGAFHVARYERDLGAKKPEARERLRLG